MGPVASSFLFLILSIRIINGRAKATGE